MKRALDEAKEERRKRWAEREARRLPTEVAVYGLASLALSTATAVLYLIAPTPFLAVAFSASIIVFAVACIVTIRLRPF